MTNTKLDAAGNTIIDSYSYTYDAAHNQTSKTDAKGVTSYTYDVLNRLETVTEPSGTLEAPSTTTTAYTYDAAGNRETETITKGTQITVNTYIYNEQNRLTRVETKVNGTLITTTEYAYDYNGNQLTTTVNGAITVNEYDCWNQLITTMTNTGTTINAYNGEGYRVSKTVNGTLTRYLYEGDKVVLELDNSGNETARNVYGSNLIMREAIRPDNSNIFDTYFYLYNGHADVTALLKPDGNIAATYYYDAFGNITATGSANNSITFAGYQYDKETGLYYLNARMYDPKTARFLQEDTYTGDRNDPLSLNLYTYCHNEPLMYYDPDGHHWKYLWIDDLINKFAGSHIGEDSTERTLITPEAYGIENSLQHLKKEAVKRGDKKLIKVCDKKINDLYKYGSVETIVETHLKYAAPAVAVPLAVSAAIVAPEALAVSMPLLTKVSTTPIGNYVLNNGDKLINKGNTVMWGVQTGSDIATGNFNSVPMDMLGTFESFMFGKQFSTANGAPLWSKNTKQQYIGKNAVQKGYLNAIQGVNRGTEVSEVGSATEKMYSVRGAQVTESQFANLRKKAVYQAWENEKQLVRSTGKGTREWTAEEMQELLSAKPGRGVTGYEGQHMKSAEAYPDFVDVPDNIQFLKGRQMPVNEHINAHGGNYQNPTNWYYDPLSGNAIDFGDIVPWKPFEIRGGKVIQR